MVLLLTVLAIIPFLTYLFVPFLNNPDTYYFYFASCGNGSISDQPILSQVLFEFIPCSELAYKIVPFLLLLASTFIVMKTSELLYKKWAFMAPIALFLTPAWVLMFSKFENDTFAYFTLVLSLYFFVKTLKIDLKKEYNKNITITIALLIISGLIWQGSFFFLIALASISIPIFIIGALTMLTGIVTPDLIFKNLLSFMFFDQVGENAPIIGFIILLSLNLVLVSIKKELKGPTIIVLFIALLNVKLGWFAIPILALSFPNLIQKIETLKGKVMTEKFVKFVVFIAIITSMMAAGVILVKPFPTYEMMQGSQDLVELTQEQHLILLNDWQMGYFVKYFGGEPSNLGQPSGFDYQKNSAILSVEEFYERDCEVIKTYYRTISGQSMRLWKC